jgi:signal transduction histidine kinase
MNKWLNKVSFRNKVLLTIVAVSILAIIVSVTPQQINAINQQKLSLEQQSRLQAKFIGQISAAGMSFDQTESVQNLLSALKSSPNTLSVTLLKRDEFTQQLSQFAYYGSPITVEEFEDIADINGIDIADEFTYIFEPILLDSSVIGYTVLKIDLSNLKSQVFNSIFLTFIAVIAALAIAFYISQLAQQTLTKPVEVLTETISNVAKNKDYSLRAQVITEDELGELTSAFNHMLQELEHYDEDRKIQEQEILSLNESLEKKVELRTNELKNTNQQLQDSLNRLQNTQQQMVEQEKMASLGSLVAGIAHEINTPIGIGITAISHLEHIIEQLEDPFRQGKLSKTLVENTISNLKECHNLVYYNLERAAQLVKSFKMVAVDQSSEDIRLFNLQKYTQDVVTSLGPELKKTQIMLELDINEHIHLYSFPGAFSQIFTNLIMNSIIHGFKELQHGTINITANQIEHELVIDYRDNGCGIAKEIFDKIFDPFFTTNRNTGGSGLGTHIIYNIVTQALGGTIQLAEDAYKGAHFIISIPWDNIRPDAQETNVFSPQ